MYNFHLTVYREQCQLLAFEMQRIGTRWLHHHLVVCEQLKYEEMVHLVQNVDMITIRKEV